MDLPFGDLLSLAQELIPPETVGLWVCQSATISAAGLPVLTYADRETVSMSVQAVSRASYDKYGLDFSKDYMTFFYSGSLQDTSRGNPGCDVIDFISSGRRYTVETLTDWKDVNGWQGAICVYSGDASEEESP